MPRQAPRGSRTAAAAPLVQNCHPTRHSLSQRSQAKPPDGAGTEAWRGRHKGRETGILRDTDTEPNPNGEGPGQDRSREWWRDSNDRWQGDGHPHTGNSGNGNRRSRTVSKTAGAKHMHEIWEQKAENGFNRLSFLSWTVLLSKQITEPGATEFFRTVSFLGS